jgi:hypothetical protein
LAKNPQSSAGLFCFDFVLENVIISRICNVFALFFSGSEWWKDVDAATPTWLAKRAGYG